MMEIRSSDLAIHERHIMEGIKYVGWGSRVVLSSKPFKKPTGHLFVGVRFRHCLLPCWDIMIWTHTHSLRPLLLPRRQVQLGDALGETQAQPVTGPPRHSQLPFPLKSDTESSPYHTVFNSRWAFDTTQHV